MVRYFFAVLAALLVALAFAASASAAVIPGSYIVVLKNGVDPAQKAAKYGITTDYVYSVPPGFSANLSDKQRNSLGRDSEVAGITANETISVTDAPYGQVKDQPQQVVPTGVQRVGGLSSPTAKIDGIDQRVDVDVAIIDSGLDRKHPDLNVAGGLDCTNERKFKPSFDDPHSHGTHVGGIVGALDNGIGVVGIAPGARLWGVRVLAPDPADPTVARGSLASIVCGIDWVSQHASTIEVANMSISARINAEIGCERTPAGFSALNFAICYTVKKGVTFAAAAGNESEDASLTAPATYPQVIAVSAMEDFDGLRGGLAPPLCDGETLFDARDDTFAYFSNFGPDIDLAAPGRCIVSTVPGGGYDIHSGTSMSAPLVAGAAALYKAKNPSATPEQVRQALIDRREKGPIPEDPDRYNEGILNVAGL